MPSKVWERTKVVFAPTEPYPLFRRLAPWPFLWLGCRTAKITVTLDTSMRIPQPSCVSNGTKVLRATHHRMAPTRHTLQSFVCGTRAATRRLRGGSASELAIWPDDSEGLGRSGWQRDLNPDFS